jgi:L-iditol 2-dehydrogenase
LMFTRLLALRGIKVLASDLVPERLQLARQWGARWTLTAGQSDFADRVRRIAKGRGLDAAIVAVPADEAVLQAQQLVRGGGQVLLFAHTRRGVKTALDLSATCVDEKDLIGSYSADFTLQKEVARLVFSRQLDARKLITHHFPLAQTAAAVDLAAHPQPNSLKIIVMAEQNL